jgi:DnaK suppressor protein
MAAKTSVKLKSKKIGKAVVKKTAKPAVKKANKKVAKQIKKSVVKLKPKAKPQLKAKPKAKVLKSKSQVKTKVKQIKTKINSKKLVIKTKPADKIKPKIKSKKITKAPVNDFSLEQENNDSNLTDNKSSLVDSNSDQLLAGPGKFEPYKIHATEEYMNDQQLNHFANILEAWKQELMVEVDHTIHDMKEADVLADLNDRATQEETFNLELRARDRERKLIKKIETALHKIKQHEYGYCDSCGVEIGVRRLEARPTATLCIECKTLAEIREKRV